MKQKRSNLARENFSEHYDTLLDSTKLLRHSTLLPSPSLTTLSLCQLFSWPISRGVCSSGCHLGCHSINTLMHYSSLHSINKAIGSPTPPAPFDLPCLCGLLSCFSSGFFPQNAFNSILFQFNCHIAGCLHCRVAFSARLALSAYLCRSARCDDWDPTRHSGLRPQAADWLLDWLFRPLSLSLSLSILYNIFALIYVLDSNDGISNGFRVLRLEFSMNFP